VDLESGEIIFAENIIWAAGVSASPLTQTLGVELDRAGRVKVNPDLSLPDHPEVFAIGDMALVLGEDGQPVPGVSPAAMQMARHIARLIKNELLLSGKSPRPPFQYRDKGSMATIGRSAAVAKVGRFEFSGFPAWLAWLGVHLIFRLFRNVLGIFHWADPSSRARRAYFPKEMAIPWRLVSQGPVVRLFLRRHRLERLAVGPWLLSQGTDRTRAAERSEDRREAV
jgi:NADH dehydrogenase FAD-containing subunit